MKKRILSLLLAICLLLGALPATQVWAAEYKGSCGAGVNWTLNTDTGVLTIRGNGVIKDEPTWPNYGEDIKTIIIEPGVTGIGAYAFDSCSNVRSVTIPEGVTYIGDDAFNNNQFSEISLPKSLVRVGAFAFAHNTKLQEIIIPKNVKTIGDGAFWACSSLKTVEIPEGVTTIGESAFWCCTSLTKISLPNSVTSLGESAFQGDTALVQVILSDNIETIDEASFYGCKSLTELHLPDALKEIGYGAFEDCTKLKGVVLPDGLEIIGNKAFSGTAIEHIKIPASVTLIDYNAFATSTLEKIAILNKDCVINWNMSDTLGKVGISTVYGHANSTAYNCAVEKGYAFEYITEDNLWEDHIATIFTDVAESAYYYEPVLWAVENNITQGMSATKFGPNSTCTRGQIVTFLWRAAGCPEPTSNKNPFTDVDADDFYYKAVLWAVEKGITSGATKTTFDPKGSCTRAQVVTFMHRAAGSPAPKSQNNPFADVSADKYYHDAVLWAVENGITQGMSAAKFGPNNTCTRGQIVTFLYRGYGK